MGFSSSIQRIPHLQGTPSGLYGSEGHGCSYTELPRRLQRIQAFFLKGGLQQGKIVEFQCSNTLSGALALLALLDLEISFYLRAPTPDAEPDSLNFCANVLRVIGEGSQDPERLYSIDEHPAYDRASGKHPSRGRLFVRTSGSLSEAKIAVHKQEVLARNVQLCASRLALKSFDRVMLPVPIFHMYGLGAGFLPSFWAGASVAFLDKANLLKILECEESFKPDVAFLTPALCQSNLQARKQKRSYKLTVSAGDVLPPETFDTYEEFHGPLVSLYGSTELGVISVSSPDTDRLKRRSTVGLPLAGIEVGTGMANNEQAPVGSPGEIWVRPESPFEGYIDGRGCLVPDHEHQRPDGFFATGDLGQRDQDGFLQVQGRCDLSVNRDGKLILFSEVEKAIEAFEGVSRALVLSTGRSARGRGLAACCVLDRPTTTNAETLRALCLSTLPRFAVPDEFAILDRLPLLANGKVDRRALMNLVTINS